VWAGVPRAMVVFLRLSVEMDTHSRKDCMEWSSA